MYMQRLNTVGLGELLARFFVYLYEDFDVLGSVATLREDALVSRMFCLYMKYFMDTLAAVFLHVQLKAFTTSVFLATFVKADYIAYKLARAHVEESRFVIKLA